MTNHKNKVLFILIHWNDTALLLRTFNKVQKLRQEKEIIIIDNNFSNKSKQDLRKKIPIKNILWADSNYGFGPAINLGITKALIKPEITHICILNNDILFDVNEIDNFLNESLLDHRNVGWGPCIIENDRPTFGGKDISRSMNTRIHANENISLAYIPGTFALFDINAFKKVGILNENYFFGGEMADFCKRLLSDNMKITINKKYSVKHLSNPETPIKIFYTIRNRFLYIHNFHHQNFTLIIRNVIQTFKLIIVSIFKLKFTRAIILTKALFYGLANIGGEIKLKNNITL